MFVADLRHFLDMPDDVPGPARRMAEQLGAIVRSATAGDAGTAWESALPCRRRPGNRACPGHIAVFRADLPAPIEWKCTSCGDEGVISGWEGSAFDLRAPRSARAADSEIVLTDDVAAALREATLLDSDCERLVFRARISSEGVVLPASDEGLDELIDSVAAEANHETNRRRLQRLDAAYAMLAGAQAALRSRPANGPAAQPAARPANRAKTLAGRWRILEMDDFDRDALDLVDPAFIDFARNGTGSFGFIAVRGWMDCRQVTIDGRPGVEFSWEGHDEGDQVSGRGRASLQADGSLRGHIYFHLGHDSGFRATRAETAGRR